MAKKQFLYENVYNDLKQKIECGDRVESVKNRSDQSGGYF